MNDTADRWMPDDLLVPAALAGSRTTMADLTGEDQAWVVVGLYHNEGLTAEAIAERLDCSVRSVRAIVASPVGRVMRTYRDTIDAADMTHRMIQGELARLTRTLAEAERDRDRALTERNRLISRLIAGGPTFGCGCPKTRYNTYRHPRTGKESCREHHRLAQAAYRARRKSSLSVTVGG